MTEEQDHAESQVTIFGSTLSALIPVAQVLVFGVSQLIYYFLTID